MGMNRSSIIVPVFFVLILAAVAFFNAYQVHAFVPDDLDFVPMGEERPGEVFTNSQGMKFVLIPAGTFMMGSPPDEPKRGDDETRHKVTISKPCYMQTTEVTVGQWRAFVTATGYKTEAETKGGTYVWNGKKWEKKEGRYWDNPGFTQTDSHPVTCVSWNDVQAFIKWLCRKEHMTYRLPTEAEWEYACRAGTETLFFFGTCLSTNDANYDGNHPLPGCVKGIYRKKTMPVASFRSNAWGLYDMHGNVWEWCEDSCEYEDKSGIVTDTYRDGIVDPLCKKGSLRVNRGGIWCGYARFCRSANRYYGSPGCRSNGLGFRLALQAGLLP